MKTKSLKNTDLQTPPIMFGGNVFGWTLDEKESFHMLDMLLDRGFTFVDTANMYGSETGESERIIGKWMKDRGARNKITLATKAGGDLGEGKNNSKKYLTKSAEESLKRLQTDHIDLFYTHFDDEKSPVEEALEAYDKLIKDGKIRTIGASNFSAFRLKEALVAAEKNSLPKYEVFQTEYNLLERREFEGKLKEVCKQEDLSVATYFSLASGFLTGKYRKEDDFEGKARKSQAEKYLNRRGLETLNILDEISDEHNISNAGVALGWLLQRPTVTTAIASATKESHLKSFEEAVDLKLSDKEMKRLNQVSKF